MMASPMIIVVSAVSGRARRGATIAPHIHGRAQSVADHVEERLVQSRRIVMYPARLHRLSKSIFEEYFCYHAKFFSVCKVIFYAS
jgi:hypothetical protein